MRIISIGLMMVVLFSNTYADTQEKQQISAKQVKYLELLTRSCYRGFAEDCWRVGDLYAHGVGVEYNPSKAIELSAKACDGQVLQGCSDLAFVHGKEGNFDKALGPATKACNGGNMQGCSSLGLLYLIGKGVQRDDLRAITLLKKACNGGNKHACEIVEEIEKE